METLPLRIGITGGIGSGKSYICRQLHEAGHPVFYCDDVAKHIIRTDERVKQKLREIVGPGVYNSDGSLCKSVLAEFLCRGNEHSALVNKVVHPRVAECFIDVVASLKEQALHAHEGHEFSGFELPDKGCNPEIDLNTLLSLPPGSGIFMECALLFEAHFERYVDVTVLVHVDHETQVRRVMQRDNVSREKAIDWMNLQLPEEKKMQLADYILNNY